MQEDLFPVVAIGASAGGLEAFTEFFKNLPLDARMAFVLVQHLDPSHPSMLSEIIAKTTKLPVEEVKSGVKVRPGRIYVIPPNRFMALTGGAFKLSPRNKSSGQHLAINFFMHSLAQERQGRAIGVVLSGTGVDGAAGLEDIKAEGGITFAQDPETAKYDGMPRAAINSGCVDLVLAPKDIAAELGRIQRHPYVRMAEPEERESELAPPDEKHHFHRIIEQLRGASGVDFSQYKPNTIQRRAMRRMMLLKMDSLREYGAYMSGHPEEALRLYDDVLIPVTSFFRDLETFEALKTQVYPAIVKDKGNRGMIRMWAPGCSTGEETYSLAMTLLEYLGDRAASFQVQIFGTDLNEKGIQKARTGVYRESIADEISPERMQRFFVKVDGGYRVNKAVRDMCIFAKQNLAVDPPFSQMNVVACRNLLIYIQPVLQRKIVPILHYALKPSGFLVMGSSESVSAFPDLFSIVDKKHKIYAKKPTASRLHYDFSQGYYPVGINTEAPARGMKKIGEGEGEWDVQVEADREVLKNYAPVGVVINDAMEVVQFRGRTTPYLEPAPGKPSLNILKLARNGLAIELRTLIAAATKKTAAVRKDSVAFGDNSQRRILNLSVSPLRDKGSGKNNFYLILFDDVTPQGALDAGRSARQKPGAADKSEHKRLKQELGDARDALRTAMENEDGLREEFQSANEEILSANEELQSTNEELETSKEELQSANEELNTLNAELRHKNTELHELSNDINNLLNSTRIPVVMLDRHLRIRRFTPAADKLLKVVTADIGRPITDIKLNIQGVDLEPLIAGVLENLQPAERDVQSIDGLWYSLNILPYRTHDNKIDGAVLALQNIDVMKTSNERLLKASSLFRGVIDTVIEPLVVLNAELRVMVANEPFLREFDVNEKETVGQFIYDLGNGQWNISKLRKALEEVLPQRKKIRDYMVEHDFERIGVRMISLNAMMLSPMDGPEPMILVAFEDVTGRKAGEIATARLAAIVESTHDAIVAKDLDGTITDWNAGAERLFGYTQKEAIGQSITMLMPPDRMEEEAEILKRIRHGEHIDHFDSVRRHKSGRPLEVSLTISPIIDAHGQVVGASKIARDISERKSAEAALIKSEKLVAAGRLAATLAHEINNPLQAVTNLIVLLERSAKLNQQDKAYAKMAAEELGRVARLTQQSLSFYRESTAPAEVDLEEILEIVLSLYEKQMQAKEISVQRDDIGDDVRIRSYPGEIRQVISTLLVNAMEAVPVRGTIAAHVRPALRWKNGGVRGVRITISDNGPGIPPENAARIFEPFFTTKGEQGTGLGLWVANGIVTRLEGFIQMRTSVHPGRNGSCFSVFLPANLPDIP